MDNLKDNQFGLDMDILAEFENITDVRIESITLHNVLSCENYVYYDTEGSSLNVLVGPNGSGKTNLLRAVRISLCLGPLFRDRRLSWKHWIIKKDKPAELSVEFNFQMTGFLLNDPVKSSQLVVYVKEHTSRGVQFKPCGWAFEEIQPTGLLIRKLYDGRNVSFEWFLKFSRDIVIYSAMPGSDVGPYTKPFRASRDHTNHDFYGIMLNRSPRLLHSIASRIVMVEQLRGDHDGDVEQAIARIEKITLVSAGHIRETLYGLLEKRGSTKLMDAQERRFKQVAACFEKLTNRREKLKSVALKDHGNDKPENERQNANIWFWDECNNERDLDECKTGGTHEALLLATALHAFDADVVLLDEPGKGFEYPLMCKLRQELIHSSKQIIATTHSRDLVSSQIVSMCAKITRKFDSKTKSFNTTITHIALLGGDDCEAYKKFLADPNRSVLLFSNRVLWVEGPSDVRVINALQQIIGESRHSTKSSTQIQIEEDVLDYDHWDVVSLDGKSNIPKALHICQELCIPSAVIADRDAIVSGYRKAVNNRIDLSTFNQWYQGNKNKKEGDPPCIKEHVKKLNEMVVDLFEAAQEDHSDVGHISRQKDKLVKDWEYLNVVAKTIKTGTVRKKLSITANILLSRENTTNLINGWNIQHNTPDEEIGERLNNVREECAQHYNIFHWPSGELEDATLIRPKSKWQKMSFEEVLAAVRKLLAGKIPHVVSKPKVNRNATTKRSKLKRKQIHPPQETSSSYTDVEVASLFGGDMEEVRDIESDTHLLPETPTETPSMEANNATVSEEGAVPQIHSTSISNKKDKEPYDPITVSDEVEQLHTDIGPPRDMIYAKEFLLSLKYDSVLNLLGPLVI